MGVKFEADFEEIARLEEKMARLPNKMEEAMNKVLHNHGIKMVKREITHVLPRSKGRKRKSSHVHARDTTWSVGQKHNLSFTVKSKGGSADRVGSFGYLVFPNEGRGRSNPREQRFMEKGLQVAVPKILEQMHKHIDKVLEEEL